MEPLPTYEQADEIEIAVHGAVDEHHIENVVAYLAALCRAIGPGDVSGVPPGGRVRPDDPTAPFREAAGHLERAAEALAGAGLHRFPRLYHP